MDINMNSLIPRAVSHTDQSMMKKRKYFHFLVQQAAQSLSVLVNTPGLTLPSHDSLARTAPRALRKGHSHPVFIFGAGCSDRLALTAQGGILEGHTRICTDFALPDPPRCSPHR